MLLGDDEDDDRDGNCSQYDQDCRRSGHFASENELEQNPHGCDECYCSYEKIYEIHFILGYN